MYPAYVHSVFDQPTGTWPMCGQGFNECNFYALANALNTQHNAWKYDPNQFKRAVGPLFQPRLGGTLPFLKALLLRKMGYGSHYGNLRYTDSEFVLRQLIDMKVPVLVDIYTASQVGFTRIYGQHSVVLVGYSDPFIDAKNVQRQEYYLIDSQWPKLGIFMHDSNNVDRDGDGIEEDYPGNRTVSRAEFLRIHTTRCYSPIFRTQTLHDAWHNKTFIHHRPSFAERVIFGSNDRRNSH